MKYSALDLINKTIYYRFKFPANCNKESIIETLLDTMCGHGLFEDSYIDVEAIGIDIEGDYGIYPFEFKLNEEFYNYDEERYFNDDDVDKYLQNKKFELETEKFYDGYCIYNCGFHSTPDSDFCSKHKYLQNDKDKYEKLYFNSKKDEKIEKIKSIEKFFNNPLPYLFVEIGYDCDNNSEIDIEFVRYDPIKKICFNKVNKISDMNFKFR